jgi:hypothetical protein
MQHRHVPWIHGTGSERRAARTDGVCIGWHPAAAAAAAGASEEAADLRLQCAGAALGLLQVCPEGIHRLLQNVVLATQTHSSSTDWH